MEYRPNVCLIIINNEGNIFLGLRAGPISVWQLPQGGIEEGDSLVDAALREAEEELGTSKFEVITTLESTHRYDFSKPKNYGDSTYCGQFQSYVVLRFIGSDADIRVKEVEHPEFSDYRWVSLGEALQLADSIRIPAYRTALEELKQKARTFSVSLAI